MRTSAWVLVVCLVAGTAAPARAIEWHLYPAGCMGGSAEVDIACGAYGRYLIGQVTTEPNCPVVRQGTHVAPGYPPAEGGLVTFPIRARRFGEVASPLVSPLRGRRGMAAVPAPGPSERKIFVVDFDGAHGDSTAWLAGQVAHGDVTPELIPLERPELGNRVGDFHAIAALCAIEQAVYAGHEPAPETVNMSFGRRLLPNDPLSVAACEPDVATPACEVARVIAQLAGRTTLVAAAGNHGEPLFPGSLPNVISAGMLDLTEFFDTYSSRRAWETPEGADALIPGNSLCLDGWAAPAGSSYSSAMLAGWIVRVLRNENVLRDLPAGQWRPVMHPTKNCPVLGKGTAHTEWCNPAITALFNELSGSTASCWHAASEPTVSAAAVSRPLPPQGIPSADSYGDPTSPQPESDPCVPCSGVMLTAGSALDLWIDVSQSEPLSYPIVIDEVNLRVGEDYFKLSLTETELDAMAEGSLAYLVVPDVGPIIPPGSSTSLWYRLEEGPQGCEEEGPCYWSSTPLLIDK